MSIRVAVIASVFENGSVFGRLLDVEFKETDWTHNKSEEFAQRQLIKQAKEYAKTLCEQGVCVIVRPMYIEQDDSEMFYREWRSFDGKDFEEVRFSYRKV